MLSLLEKQSRPENQVLLSKMQNCTVFAALPFFVQTVLNLGVSLPNRQFTVGFPISYVPSELLP